MKSKIKKKTQGYSLIPGEGVLIQLSGSRARTISSSRSRTDSVKLREKKNNNKNTINSHIQISKHATIKQLHYTHQLNLRDQPVGVIGAMAVSKTMSTVEESSQNL